MSKISKKWLISWEFLIFFFFQNSQLFNRREKNRWKNRGNFIGKNDRIRSRDTSEKSKGEHSLIEEIDFEIFIIFRSFL